MTNNKRPIKNWNDVQIAIATISMALTLLFWNLFAGPDRETALRRAREQAALSQAERDRIALEQATQPQVQVQPPVQVIAQPTPMTGPLFLGGSVPQTRITVGGGGGGGNSGGGTGGS
jgi:hypothetical protein